MRFLIIFLLLSSNAFGQENIDILSFTSSKLNDSIPSYLPKKSLLHFLGNPTKIEKFESECALTESQERAKDKKIYYYDCTKFFVYDNESEIVEINFRSGKFSYNTERINLSNKTTIQDLKKVYPNSVKSAIKENGGTLVRFRPCKECDGYCFLFFEKGKLVKLKWYNEC